MDLKPFDQGLLELTGIDRAKAFLADVINHPEDNPPLLVHAPRSARRPTTSGMGTMLRAFHWVTGN